jgi:hypothetical protein
MLLPRAYQIITHYWRLSDRQATHLWAALAKSHAPRPCAWRYQVLAFAGKGYGSSTPFTDAASRPATLMGVIEDLIAEGRLPAQEGRAIEELLLRRTSKEGRWLG